jgi:hypothetical protein
MQVFPAQHPLGHDVASHTQAPLTQRWPAPQAGPVPQVQLPFVQLSALVALQATHAAPLVPQLVSDGDDAGDVVDEVTQVESSAEPARW